MITPKMRVVVPIDFSSSSAPAIREAMRFVDDVSGIFVLHVLRPLDSLSPGVIFGGVTDETRISHVSSYMNTWLSSREIADVQTEIRVGDPGREITKFAAECKADLIVIPTHGHSGIQRALLGSVAERVIRFAPCRVLVIRSTEDADIKVHPDVATSTA